MTKTTVGEATVIEMVPEDDRRLLEFLDKSDLRPGTEIRVKELASYKGTIIFEAAGKDVVLGMDVAEQVMVRA